MTPRPFGPHPIHHGSVHIPVRDRAGGFVFVKVSPEDYRLAMGRPLSLDADGYVRFHVYDERKGKSVAVFLHRAIVRAPRDRLVHHRYGNLLDCRQCALLVATHSENSGGWRRRTGRSSSKYRGVVLHAQTGKWQAQLKHRDVNYYLGLFDSEEAAALAYNRKAVEVWGRFAHLNRVLGTKIVDLNTRSGAQAA